MAYQPFSIIGGSGGYSKLNDPASKTHSGAVACLDGSCWVRLLKTATVTASGANNDITPPGGSGFEDGWAYLSAGDSLAFGQERVSGATQSETEPVGQIDIYIADTADISCMQH